MTDPSNPSALNQQLAILNEALEEQRIAPHLESDLKCVEEMKKLLALVNEGAGHFDETELVRVYTSLAEHKESFNQGLERLKSECFASRFFNWFSTPVWDVGEAARDQLCNQTVIAVIDEWVSGASAGENRLEAKNRILECLWSQKTRLDLEGLDLQSLPDIFNHKILEGSLQVLSVYSNCLTALPESLGNLIALIDLDVGYNQLTALPESLANLRELTSLYVGDNQLIALPENLGNLTALKDLVVDSNLLTALPESLGNLRALWRLCVHNNQLTALPESLGNLTALTILNVSANRLTALPESLGNLTALTDLVVGYNQLTGLPGSLGNLRALQYFEVINNQALTSVPNAILSLPANCTVNLSGCGLSQVLLGRLQAAVSAPGYQGPRIHHSILDPRNPEALGRSLPDLFQDLVQITGRALSLPDIHTSVDQERLLQMWLGRLCYMADYGAGGEKRREIASKVQDYLQMASDNPAFREVFYAVIQGAALTCGDRVALSLMHLGLAHDLTRIDVRNKGELANFLIRGVFVMSLLEDIARMKVASLRFVDEIEVYLGYPIMLKERLQLPINADQMLYARSSNITHQDLNTAEGFIREHLGNEEILTGFLVKQDKWKEALKESYPVEIQALERQKALSLEAASKATDYEKIEEQFALGLVELTKRAVNLRELSF